MRLIDADKINFSTTFIGNSELAKDCRDGAQSLIDIQPTVDAVEVVRCVECIHHTCEEPGMVYCPAVIGGWVGNEFYCGDGERKEVSEDV